MTERSNDDRPLKGDEPAASEGDLESMVRSYEDKYRVPRLEDILNDADEVPEDRPTSDDFVPSVVKPKRSGPKIERKTSPRRRIATTDEERKWATIAHASAILTLVAGLFSAGFLALLTLFIPLGIYFYWRQKSEYVAFQALQAFTLQVLGTVGWLAVLTIGMLVGALLLVVLAITIVGVLLYLVVIPAMVLFALGSLALPVGMIVYSVIAALQTSQGVDYRLPRIGRWIDNQMHNTILYT